MNVTIKQCDGVLIMGRLGAAHNWHTRRSHWLAARACTGRLGFSLKYVPRLIAPHNKLGKSPRSAHFPSQKILDHFCYNFKQVLQFVCA